MGQAGKDATTQFDSFHKKELLDKYQHLLVGHVEKPGAGVATKKKSDTEVFGEGIPYGDPYDLFYNF